MVGTIEIRKIIYNSMVYGRRSGGLSSPHGHSITPRQWTIDHRGVGWKSLWSGGTTQPPDHRIVYNALEFYGLWSTVGGLSSPRDRNIPPTIDHRS